MKQKYYATKLTHYLWMKNLVSIELQIQLPQVLVPVLSAKTSAEIGMQDFHSIIWNLNLI